MYPRSAPPERLHVALGPRAAETRLLDALAEDQRAARADPSRLARPLYVVVPSESLRLHLAERLATTQQCALGLRLTTLPGLARAVLERAGIAWPLGERLLPLFARRRLAEFGPLEDLQRGRDGLAAVAATLRDLFHAGFEAALLEPLEEALEPPTGSVDHAGDAARARARALLRLAARLERDLQSAGAAAPGAWARRTREALRAEPALLGARALWIHGFTDAPGTTSELLHTLVEHCGAHCVYDALALALPAGVHGAHFGEAHAARLSVPRPPARAELVPRGTELGFVRALGQRAELRAVASALAERLRGGARPERLAVVARSLEGPRTQLAAALRALGVPFSGVQAEGSLTPRARALHALADLVEEGEQARVVRFARAGWRTVGEAGVPAHELLAALALLGASRLSALAALDLAQALEARTELVLPGGRGAVRPAETSGDAEGDEPDEEDLAQEEPGASATPSSRRRVPRAALELVQRAAADWTGARRRLLRPGPIAALARGCAPLFAQAFPALAEDVEETLAELAEELPAACVLSPAEFEELFAEALRARATSPLGGEGGGVQVLDALAARSRTFDELFLVDLVQGAFPRPAREDALLPDRLRLRLASVLPDLQLKGAALVEEEALFASLLESTPRATLSWQSVDEDGLRRTPSPFVRRAWRETPAGTEGLHTLPCAGPILLAAGDANATSPTSTGGVLCERTEFEELALAALASRARFADELPRVLATHGRTEERALVLARARLAGLAELEPAPSAAPAPNLYLGCVGPLRHPADPRRNQPWVSTLERLAVCPWQALLGRVLGLVPPLASVPTGAELEPVHVGSLVHRVLQELSASGVPTWPRAAELAALVERSARALASEEGLVPSGLARVLALQALPYLEVARELDQRDPPSAVRVEVEGSVAALDGRRVPFRADRVERRAQDGDAELWIDFKTSRHALSDGKKEETRLQHLRERVRNGHALQAAAYALGAGPAGRGRYVYLHPALAPHARLHEARADDGELARTFHGSLAQLFAAWDQGAFPPRLVDRTLRKEHPGCRSCDFHQACQRGDSGARARSVAWVLAREQTPPEQELERALDGLWRMLRPPAEAAP